MYIRRGTFKTTNGDSLGLSVILGLVDQLNQVSLTIYKKPANDDRRRKVFGCKLDFREWRRLLSWLRGGHKMIVGMN